MAAIYQSDQTTHQCSTGCRQNLSDFERGISIGAGVILACVGIGQKRMSGFLTAAVGAGLIYRGTTEHCALYQALGIKTKSPKSNEHLDVRDNNPVDAATQEAVVALENA